ncbi:MAG TPA: hypothetical protein VEZ55_04675, partial [Chitinophagaceae bacterium]|nr:hypothetical protein [Chitinophagaceae bacterium]
QYTPSELASILQVEYIITGSVAQEKGNVNTSSNHQSNETRKIEGKGNSLQLQEKENTTGFSTTVQNIQTNVSISIYNDKGEKLYSKSRESLMMTTEAYKSTLQYLLKRTPLYKR